MPSSVVYTSRMARLFPTGIGVNPMITVMALARRTAATILAET